MKKSFFFLVLHCLTVLTMAQSNAVDEMFRKYSEKEGFSLITISKTMFSMLANIDSDNEDADNIIKNLRSIQILTVQDSLLNMNLNFYNELSKTSDLSVYEELMVVKEGRDVTKFLIRENGDRITELLVISGGPGGNSLISIKGNLSMKNISDLSRSMKMEELNGLENIEKNQQ